MGRRCMAVVVNERAAESPRVGVVFPGQGSQVVGMASDLAAEFPAAASVLEQANAILGYDLAAIMRDGPDETLRQTRYSQPAIFVANVALFAAIKDVFTPVVSAGHSFGEYCSLTIADAMPFDAALHLVAERGLAMQRAAELAPGGMTAILGFDLEPLRNVVVAARSESGGRVDLANFNAPDQIVISGDVAAVEVAARLALEAGAKRAVVLNVSGAWHSALMEPAKAEFAPFVAAAPIRQPRFEVISNVDAQPYRDVETIRRNLVTSVASEVRWYEVALQMVERKLDLIIELGASPVLAALLKRIPDAPKRLHAGNASGLRKAGEALAAIAV